MKPTIPPPVIRFVSGLTYEQVKDGLGVCMTKAIRVVRKPWSKWKVGEAETFCRLAGFDFWNLSLATNPELRAAFARVEWSDTDDVTVRRALDSLISEAGGTPTGERRRSLASALRRTFKVQSSASPPAAPSPVSEPGEAQP